MEIWAEGETDRQTDRRTDTNRAGERREKEGRNNWVRRGGGVGEDGDSVGIVRDN